MEPFDGIYLNDRAGLTIGYWIFQRPFIKLKKWIVLSLGVDLLTLHKGLLVGVRNGHLIELSIRNPCDHLLLSQRSRESSVLRMLRLVSSQTLPIPIRL